MQPGLLQHAATGAGELRLRHAGACRQQLRHAPAAALVRPDVVAGAAADADADLYALQLHV